MLSAEPRAAVGRLFPISRSAEHAFLHSRLGPELLRWAGEPARRSPLAAQAATARLAPPEPSGVSSMEVAVPFNPALRRRRKPGVDYRVLETGVASPP